jgi:predicted alpha/beta hydrolase family esterase
MDKDMTKTLIVPGLDGSSEGHWQRWWAATDPHAILLDLADPVRPVPTVWEIGLAQAVLQHPDCILVGHSLGAVVIARLLATWPHLRVRAALLVAPAETNGSDRISHFGPIPERPLDVPTTLVASRNDPWMSFARANNLARSWGSELVDLGRAGHINAASGFGPWRRGRGMRDELALQTAPAAPNAYPEPRMRLLGTTFHGHLQEM